MRFRPRSLRRGNKLFERTTRTAEAAIKAANAHAGRALTNLSGCAYAPLRVGIAGRSTGGNSYQFSLDKSSILSCRRT